MKIKPMPLLDVWNYIEEIFIYNDNPPVELTSFVKRLRVVASDEIHFWNSLNVEERFLIVNDEMDIPIQKIPIDKLPENIPAYLVPVLQLVYDGEIPQQESVLEKLLKQKKDKGKNDEPDTNNTRNKTANNPSNRKGSKKPTGTKRKPSTKN